LQPAVVNGAFIMAGLSRVPQPGWEPGENDGCSSPVQADPGGRLPDSGESGHNKSPVHYGWLQ